MIMIGDYDANGFLSFLVAHALATNPALMEAVQNKLNGLVGKTSGYIERYAVNLEFFVKFLAHKYVIYQQIW